MSRLQKKCFIASACFHLSLGLILLVGPGFFSPQKRADDRPPSEFIPDKLIDELFSNPGARSLPAPSQPQTPLRPAVTPPPATVRPPEPTPPARQTPDPSEVKPSRQLPDVSLTPVVRPRNNQPQKPRVNNSNDSERDAAQERERRFAGAARAAARNLERGLSSPTEVELRGGEGSGVSYANFLDVLKKIYSDAWMVPDGVTDNEATAKASVTIARNGRVLSWKVVRSSGNSLADASVEMALRRVTVAVPLPDSAKEDQRTVTITFSVKAKRGLE